MRCLLVLMLLCSNVLCASLFRKEDLAAGLDALALANTLYVQYDRAYKYYCNPVRAADANWCAWLQNKMQSEYKRYLFYG